MGEHALSVPVKLHAINRGRLCEALKKKDAPKGALVVLQGGESQTRYSSDTDVVFIQVKLPWIHCLAICTLSEATQQQSLRFCIDFV